MENSTEQTDKPAQPKVPKGDTEKPPKVIEWPKPTTTGDATKGGKHPDGERKEGSAKPEGETENLVDWPFATTTGSAIREALMGKGLPLEDEPEEDEAL